MLRGLKFESEYRTGDNDPIDFYRLALSESQEYWRAAGYFSSGLFDLIGRQLGDFVRRDGTMRLVTSVFLSEEDRDSIARGTRSAASVVEEEVAKVVEEEFQAPLAPGVELLASLLKVGRLEIKLATRSNGGLYHEKIGTFEDVRGDFVAFIGSANETLASARDNFESLEVFTSWEDPERAVRKKRYLKQIWEDPPPELAVYEFPEALSKIIVRRYETESGVGGAGGSTADLYSYQEDAVDWFVDPERANGVGILWMATGTGKTITALKIANRLFQDGRIDAVVLNTSERLLKQWYDEMKEKMPGTQELIAPWLSMTAWQTGSQKEAADFRQLSKRGRCLFVTYSFLPNVISDCVRDQVDLSRILLIVDEVHNAGANQNVEKMSLLPEETEQFSESEINASLPSQDPDQATMYSHFGFRLGLSATPFNDYDDRRNQFILNGFTNDPVQLSELESWDELEGDERRAALDEAVVSSGGAFRFGLADAVRRGILVPFDYCPLPYEPTDDEKQKRIGVFRYWKAKADEGEASPSAPYIHMSRVFKASENKLPVFEEYLERLRPPARQNVLARSIIFVQTKDYGRRVCKQLHQYGLRYHTFFTGDDATNLRRFSNGDLDLLVTCHMISEGVDIKSVDAIVLFASDRQRLETIQRIGRALRRNPEDPSKTATVIDFVYLPGDEEGESDSADALRMKWLQELSDVRAEER